MEVYPFGGDGTALRQFGSKVFVTACPGSGEWLEILKGLVDKATELGCSGVFFDQLGYRSVPCCDPAHGHRVPFMTAGAAKAEMVKQLRAYVKSRNPEMSFGIEWFNDVTGFHADYIHNIFDSGNPFHCPEFVRYLFPELVTTDRCIRDDRDIERRVNLAIRLGLRSDVEIYRCRALIDETPHYKEYLTRANAFRERNRALILDGRFRDTVGASCDNPKVGFAVFEAGRRCAGSAKCTGVEDQHRRAAAFDRHDKLRHPLPAMMQKRTQFAEGGRFGLKRALRQAGAIPLGNGVASGPAIRMRVMVAPGQERLAVRIEQQRTVVVNGDRDAEQPFRRIDRLRQITSGAARVKFIQKYRFQHDSVNIQQNAPLSNCRFRGILWKIQRRRYEYCAQGV